MFYDNYLKICETAGIAPTSLLVELGISKGALSGWKSGAEPSNRTKKAIADYFKISVTQLMSGEIEKPGNIIAELPDIDKQFIEVLHQMTEEQKRMILAQIKGLLSAQQ